MALTKEQMQAILDSKNGRYINAISIESLYDFIVNCYLQYGSMSKLKEANNVIEVVEQMLEKKKQISENNVQSFVVVIFAAGLLHNMFYDGSITSLFLAREKLEPLARKYNIPNNYIEALFQTIEAQLGEDTPVPQCKPIPNSPTELFAWACWFVKEYKMSLSSL